MHEARVPMTSNERAEEDVQGFFAVGPRNPSTGKIAVEQQLLDLLRQGQPVFTFPGLAGIQYPASK